MVAFAGQSHIHEEHGWFAEDTGSFFGAVLRDTIDDDWHYVIVARDQYLEFRAIDIKTGFATRALARLELQHQIAVLLSAPQRIFSQ